MEWIGVCWLRSGDAFSEVVGASIPSLVSQSARHFYCTPALAVRFSILVLHPLTTGDCSMPTSRPLRLAVLIATSAMAACSEAPTPVPAPEPLQLAAKVDTPAAATDGGRKYDLMWLPDGSRLVVDGYWVFDPERGTFVSLQCATPSGSPCTLMQSSFVADGTEYVAVDGESMAVGTLAGGVGAWEPIPRWVAEAESGKSQNVVNTVFWVAPGRVFVRQFHEDGHGEAQCRVRYTANRVVGDWRLPAGGCVAGDLSYLTEVNPGPANLLALHSSTEGSSALGFVRYRQDVGPSAVSVAPVAIAGSSNVTVRFAPDGTRVEVISPCTLAGGPQDDCANSSDQRAWKQYSLPIPGDKVELLRDDLPPGTVADPVHDRFAWVKAGLVCVGEPRDTDADCEELPVR
jgi:hypothetical protein